MLTIRVFLEAGFIFILISIFTYALIEWDSLKCSVPFNIWLISFSLLNISTRSLFMLVAIVPDNFYILMFAAYTFFFVLNPLNILCTGIGICFYGIVCTNGFICGTLVNSWGIIVCLAIGVTYGVLAVLQSVRIFRSIRFLRRNTTDGGLGEDFGGSLNRIEQLTNEELERLPVFRAVGSYVGIECVICHERINNEEILRNLPGCTHIFHKHCVDSWLQQNPTCPLCRNNVRMSIL